MVGLGNLGQFTQFYTPIYSRGHKMAKNIFKNFLRFFDLWFLGPKKGHLPHFGAEKMTQDILYFKFIIGEITYNFMAVCPLVC